MLVIVETEIWPNLLREAFRRGVPTLLLSGRLSAKALPRYALFRAFFRRVLGYFSAIGMQSREDAARILELGAEQGRVSVVGNLKFAASRPGHEGANLAVFSAAGNKWIVAGSTHRGEEEILLKVFVSLRPRFPKLSMVLAPRHPERFAEVEKLLQQGKYDFYKRSDNAGDRMLQKEILLLDSIGELSDFFSISDVAFVGGSLVNAGGHNVLEPARWQKPILFGPHMANFESLAEELKQTGAALEVSGADDLFQAMTELLGDAERCRRMGQRAAAIAAGKGEAFLHNLSLTERYL